MAQVTIDRELLERCLPFLSDTPDLVQNGAEALGGELRAILAAPRQPEGEGLEVVGYGFPNTSLFGKPRMMMLAPEIPSDDQYGGAMWEPLVRLSDAQRAIAELREECEHLKDCQENAMLHMTGLVSERDTLRQQLAELRAQLLAIASAEPRRHTIEWAKAMAATGNNEAALDKAQALNVELREECERLRMQLAACGVVALANTSESAAQARQMHPDYMSASCSDVADAVDREITLRQQLADMRQQRDRLAELLRMVRQDGWYHPLEDHEIAHIDAALAEVKP